MRSSWTSRITFLSCSWKSSNRLCYCKSLCHHYPLIKGISTRYPNNSFLSLKGWWELRYMLSDKIKRKVSTYHTFKSRRCWNQGCIILVHHTGGLSQWSNCHSTSNRLDFYQHFHHSKAGTTIQYSHSNRQQFSIITVLFFSFNFILFQVFFWQSNAAACEDMSYAHPPLDLRSCRALTYLTLSSWDTATASTNSNTTTGFCILFVVVIYSHACQSFSTHAFFVTRYKFLNSFPTGTGHWTPHSEVPQRVS